MLTFSNQKSYIGLTTQNPARRFSQHKCDAARGGRSPVHGAWRRYGPPELRVLAVVGIGDLLATEIRAIQVFGTLKPRGYNLSPGGDTPPAWIPGVPEKISAAAKGRIPSPEVRKKRGDAVRVALADPTVRAKMSAAATGHDVSEETRAKIRAKHVGKTLTPEHREKLKVARNARPPASQETKAKMSASHLAYREAQREAKKGATP